MQNLFQKFLFVIIFLHFLFFPVNVYSEKLNQDTLVQFKDNDDAAFEYELEGFTLTFMVGGTANYYYSGTLTGSGYFTKTGTGTLRMTDDSSIIGDVNVNEGTLAVDSKTRLGDTSDVTVNINSGGTFDINTSVSGLGYSLFMDGGTLSGSSGTTIVTSGINLNSDSTIISDGTLLTVSGKIVGSGGFNKTGSSKLTLGYTSGNTYTGSTTITNGTLSISNINMLGGNPATADADNITFAGGTLEYTGSGTETTASNKGVTISSNSTVNVSNSSGELRFGGSISGSANLTKTGAGDFRFNNSSNSFSGALIINQGEVRLTSGTSNAYNFDVTVQNNANLAINDASFNTNNTITVESGGAVNLYGGTGSGRDFTGNFNIAGTGNTNGLVSATASAITTTGDADTDVQILGTVTLSADASVLYNGNNTNISGGKLQFGNDVGGTTTTAVNLGSNTLTLMDKGSSDAAAKRVYEFFDLVTGTGTLDISQYAEADFTNAEGSLADTVNIDVDGTLKLDTSDTVASLQGSGEVNISSGTFTVNQSSTTSYSGIISGAGNFAKSGSGQLTISGNNTYTGSTNVSAGTLVLSGNSTRLNATTVSGGTLTVSGSSTSSGNLTVTGGTFNLTGTNTTTGNISVSGGTFNLSGTNTTSGTVTVSGGLLNVTGGNTYTGSTTISGGTLRINNFGDIGGSLSADDTDNIILSGGTLDYVGTGNLNLDAEKGLRLTANSTINVEESGGSLRFRQSINQSATGIILTKTGVGNLRFVSMNDTDSNFNGTVSVSEGTLQISDVSGGNNPWADFDVTIANGAGMRVNNSAMESGTTITVNDGATVILRSQSADLRIFESDFSISGNGNSTYSSVANEQAAIVGDLKVDDDSDIVIRGTVTLTGDSSILMTDIDADTISSSAFFGIGDATDNSRTAVALGSNTLTLKGISGGTRRNYTIADQVTGTGTLEVENNVDLYLTKFGFSDSDMFNNGDLADTVNVDVDGRIYFNKNDTIATLQGSGSVSLENATLTISNTSGTTTFSGVIQDNSGTGSIVKDGNSTLVLSGANTYTGTTTITAGTLTVSGSLSDSTAVSVTGTYDVDASDTIASIEGSGNVELASGVTLTAGDSNDKTVSGVISGAGSFTKAGSGTLTLSGTNTFTGSTTISAGTVSISASAGLGATPSSADADNIIFNNNATLNTTATFTLGANKGITMTGAGTIDTDASTVLTYGGIITGSGDLTKSGSGELILSGTSTYTGATQISAGKLTISSNANLGATPDPAVSNNIIFNGGTLKTTSSFTLAANRGISLTGNGTFETDSSTTLTVGGVISGSESVTKVGAGELILSGTNTYTGSTTIRAGTISISSSANLGATPGSADADNIIFNGGTLNASSSFTLGANKGITMTGAGTFDVDDSVTLTYGGSITGSGNISKTGSGTLLLSGDSQSASGDLTVSGGTLSLGSQSAFNYGHTSGLSITLNSGTTLTNSGNFYNRLNDLTINSATLTSTGGETAFSGKTVSYQLNGTLTSTGTSTISNNDILLGYNGSGTTFDVESGGTLTVSSNLLNSQSPSWPNFTSSGLTKSSAGTLVLSGSNEYSGSTTISAGILRAINNSALGTTAGGTTVADGASLELYNTGSEYTVSEPITISGTGISGSGAIQSTGLIEIDSAITLNANSRINANSGSTLTISGSSGIDGSSGNYDLTLGGAGNITVSAPINLGTGALTKSVGGTLSITGALTVGSITDGSRASIAADVSTSGTQNYQGGADLTGDITLTASTLTIGDGDSTDTIVGNGNDLTVTGNLDLNAAATTFDNISVSGTSDLGGNVTSTGTQTYSGATTLSGGNRTLTGSTVNFASTLAGGSNSLTITGGLDLDGAASGLASLSVSGASNLGANVVTTGNQTYSGAVTVSNSITLSGGASTTVNFESTVVGSGTENLTLNANADIDGAISNLASLSVSGTSNIGANITTSGTQTYTGAVTLSGSAETIQLSGSIINFASTVTGGSKNLLSVGATDIDGAVSGINNLVVQGNTDIGANVTSTGNQNYSAGTTTFTSTATLTAGTVFLGNVTGSTNDITITGNLTLSGNVASGNELTVSGNSTLGGNVTTTSHQNYGGNVTLGANNTFTTTNSVIGFGGTVNSSNSTARNITASVGTGALRIDGIVGGTNAVGTIGITGDLDLNAAIASATSVSVSGASNLGANVTTSGTQVYNGTNTLSNDVSLTTTNSNITLDKTDSDSTTRDLTASIGTGTLNITGTVGATNALGAIDITGNLDLDSTINASSLSVSGTTDLSDNVTTSGTQTYTGTTTISENTTLTATSVSVGTVTGSSKDLTVTGNLITTGDMSGVSILSVSGTSTLGGNVTTNSNQTYTGNITLNGATTLQGQRITATSINNSGNNLTINTNNASTAVTGVISGSGGLIKAGSGTLTLSADSTYSGNTRLDAGTVIITSAGSITSDTITLNNNSVLDLKGTDVVSAGATITVGSSAQLHVRQNNTIGTAAGSGVIRIRDNRNLTVENNSFTGQIKGQGNLIVQGSFVLGGSGKATLGDTNNSSLNNVNTIVSGSGNTLTLGAANALISGNDLTIQNSGTLNISGFSQTVSTIDADGTIKGGTDSSKITATTAINLKSGELTSGTKIDGSVALSKSTSGTFELKGKAKHTGNTNVTAGVLDVTGSIEDTDTVNVNGGTLKLRNSSALHSNADISVSSGTLEVKENIQVRDFAASGGSTTIDDGKQLTINPTTNNQQVTGLTGSGIFKKTGSRTTILTGTNNFSGKTQVTGGILRVDGTLSSNTKVAVESGATLDIRNDVIVNTIEDAGDITTSAGNKFTISDSENKTFYGKLRGAGNYEKSGSGTLTLTGESDTSGSVIVSGGILYAGTASSNADTIVANTVTVNSGGTLGGGGRVGGITSNGGTLAPGNSIGTLYVDGNLELDSSSNTSIEFNASGSDQIIVSGDITIDGTITLKPENATYATVTREIIDGSSGSGTFSGTFSTVTIDTSSNLNGATASITYDTTLRKVLLNITASTSDSDDSNTVNSKTTNPSLKTVADIFDNATATKLANLKTYWVSADATVVDSELNEAKGTVLATSLLQTQKTHNTFQKALTNVTAMGATSTVGNITRSSGTNLTLAQLQEAGLFRDKNNWSEHWDYSDQSVLGFLKNNKNKTLLSGDISKDRSTFLRTYGGKTKRNNIGTTFTGYNNDTYGILFGEQIRVASNIFNGYSYGFSGSDTDYNDNYGESVTYSGHASIFRQIDNEKNNISLIAGGYISNTDSKRNVTVGSGGSAINDTYESEMTDVGINATAQYTHKFNFGGWGFSPTASLQGSYEIKDDTKEGGGVLALNVKNDNLFTARPEIGLSLDKDFSKLEEEKNVFNFSVFASQDHYLDGTKSTANYAADSTTFQLKTPRDEETYVSAGFGYNYVNDEKKSNLIANAFYTENTDNDLKSNIFSITYRKLFGDFGRDTLPPVIAKNDDEDESIIDKTIKTVKKSLAFKKPTCDDGQVYRAFECKPDEKTLQLVANKLYEINKREPTLRDKIMQFYVNLSYYLPLVTFIAFIILIYEVLRSYIVASFKFDRSSKKVVVNKNKPKFFRFVKNYFNEHFEYI